MIELFLRIFQQYRRLASEKEVEYHRAEHLLTEVIELRSENSALKAERVAHGEHIEDLRGQLSAAREDLVSALKKMVDAGNRGAFGSSVFSESADAALRTQGGSKDPKPIIPTGRIQGRRAVASAMKVFNDAFGTPRKKDGD